LACWVVRELGISETAVGKNWTLAGPRQAGRYRGANR
jgi:hypothetical protein